MGKLKYILLVLAGWGAILNLYAAEPLGSASSPKEGQEKLLQAQPSSSQGNESQAACPIGSDPIQDSHEPECAPEEALILSDSNTDATNYGEEDECRKIYVIAANRFFAQDVLDVPQAVEVLTDYDINEHSVYQDIEHIIQELPNISLGMPGRAFSSATPSPNNNQSYWDEGVTIRGLGAQRVLIVNDGVRQANQGIGYGGGNLSLYDISAIGSIEILKGPSSVVYGTDAIGGVLSIKTREPQVRSEPGMNGRVKGDYDGSRRYYRTSGFVDIGNEKCGLIFGGMYSDYEVPHLPKGQSANGGSFQRYGEWMKFNYYLSDNATWKVFANRLNNRNILVNRDIINFYFQPIQVDIPRYDRSQIGTQLELKNLSNCLDASITTLNWQQVRRNFHRYTFTANHRSRPPIITPSSILTNDKSTTFELDQQLKFDFCPHTLVMGADLGYDTTHSPETRIIPIQAISLLRASAYQARIGVYVQDTWDLSPCEIVSGIRYDYFNVHDHKNYQELYNQGLSGSLGFNYRCTSTTSYYMNFSTGFRVPDLSERFQLSQFYFVGENNVYGNPTLKPERSYAVELGTKANYECISYQLAIFANQVDNYIGIQDIGSSSRYIQNFRYNNMGGVLLYGLEGKMVYNPDDYWKFFANAARTLSPQWTKISLANWTLNYGVSYKLPICCGYIDYLTPEISARTVYKSRDTINSFVTNPRVSTTFGQFTTVNAQIAANLSTSSDLEGRIIVGVNNIFNRLYREPFMYAYQPGAGVFASAEIRF